MHHRPQRHPTNIFSTEKLFHSVRRMRFWEQGAIKPNFWSLAPGSLCLGTRASAWPGCTTITATIERLVAKVICSSNAAGASPCYGKRWLSIKKCCSDDCMHKLLSDGHASKANAARTSNSIGYKTANHATRSIFPDHEKIRTAERAIHRVYITSQHLQRSTFGEILITPSALLLVDVHRICYCDCYQSRCSSSAKAG